MTQQIGRNVYHEKRIERVVRLSLFSKVIRAYYQLRIKLIEKRKEKYGGFSDYRLELFYAAVSERQAYLHKGDALYMKNELRMLREEAKKGV